MHVRGHAAPSGMGRGGDRHRRLPISVQRHVTQSTGRVIDSDGERRPDRISGPRDPGWIRSVFSAPSAAHRIARAYPDSDKEWRARHPPICKCR